MKVSVAMAVYEGETYLQQQIDSILSQLCEQDELIVSLNPSRDASEEILASYANDARVKVYKCFEKGILANFENAIRHCQNEIIFLADQDDVWLAGKVQRVLSFFTKDVVLVEHDCVYTNEQLETTSATLFQTRSPHPSYIKNLLKNAYQGSCMAFRKELTEIILPIPRNICMHDQWIGLLASTCGKVYFLKEAYMLYRRHASANTDDRRLPLAQKIHNILTMQSEIHKRQKLWQRKRKKD